MVMTVNCQVVNADSLSNCSSESDSLEPMSSNLNSVVGGSGVPLYPDSCITDDGFNTVFMSLLQQQFYVCKSIRFFEAVLDFTAFTEQTTIIFPCAY